MADEVAHEINGSKTGREGIAIVNTNGFKIMPSDQDSYTLNTPSGIGEIYMGPLSDVALSGNYVDRFDDPQYYYA